MRKVRTHSFNGIKYDICFCDGIDGRCEIPEGKPELTIGCRINTQRGLITLIHEAMHAGNWDKHEETVDRSSKEIGRLLWRLGWRVENASTTT